MTAIYVINMTVKWKGEEYRITDITNEDTVAILKHEIYKRTQVRPERQKLINLKYKGKPAVDKIKIGELELKENFKLMLIGSTEADIENVCQSVYIDQEIINDFDEPEEETGSLEKSPIYQAKIQKRVREYQIDMLHLPTPNKRLLILDIDYTLFDHHSVAEKGIELMRPYLHEFLKSAYEYYDIAIWSATGMRWIKEKMKLLGVSSNENYKIMCYLDSNAMISVYTPERGVFDVKPLGLIWGIYPQYSSKNSIIFDDMRRNFLMNPRSGLRIRPFRDAHINRKTDNELLKLSKYLRYIAIHCEDFNKLDHSKWEYCIPKQ